MSETTKPFPLWLKLLGTVAAVLAAISMGYLAAFCTWATATPLSPQLLAQYQWYAKAWSAGFVISLVLALALAASAFRQAIRRWQRPPALT